MSDIPKRCPACGQFVERPCPKCMGRGFGHVGYADAMPCPECGGRGLVDIDAALEALKGGG